MESKMMKENINAGTVDAKAVINAELGISDTADVDKGNLTSRQNGYHGAYVGGEMTKRLVEMGEKQLSHKQ